MQSRDAAHPLGEHSMLEFSASSGHPHTLLHLLSFLGGSVRFYISSGCFTLLLLLKMLIFRVWSNQGWLLGVLGQRAGSSAGDNLAPLFKNPASFPEIPQILVNQYFIKPRAASPGESCGVRNPWVVWRVLPWHPPPPIQHPQPMDTVPDKDRWDLALPFTALNAGDLSQPGFS